MKRFFACLTVAGLVAVPVLSAQTPQRSTAPKMVMTASSPGACQLRTDMRILWTDHVVWTRDYVIAAVADSPDASAAAARLMRNQEDIGNAVGQFYGAAAGTQLTTLLKAHISTAVDVVKGAKSGDKAALDAANKKWSDNAMEIAAFLAKANPNWPRLALEDMMKKHLSTTTDEVVARLHKDWDADAKAYDAVYDHILKMADTLAEGIAKQFPEKIK